MSVRDLKSVVIRAANDAEFFNDLNRDPDRALSHYQLTGEERAAILAADGQRLVALGIDPRLTQGIIWMGRC